ncbi:MAG TPA: ABC transporter substrate-binding protein, partial [Phenylobacterium sp.]|nr:ABC transporter substrate-binding protein [Phenylobacterium sp.]
PDAVTKPARKPIDGPKLLLLAFAHRTITDYRLSVRHRFHSKHHDWHLQKPLQIRHRDVLSADRVIHSPFFVHVCEALHFPFTAEEIVALQPDLVLASRFSPPATRAALARMGVRSELFSVPSSVAESLAQVMQIANAVNRPDRGRALVARIEAALAAAAPPPRTRRLSAITFQSGGFAAGPGTMMDEMMRRAGFDNAVTRYGLNRSGNVGLEQLVADPPDVLLAGQLAPGAPTWADRVIAHPALRRARLHRAAFPQNLTFCGGPVLIDCAAMLAKARREALA